MSRYVKFGERPDKYQCIKRKCKWEGTMSEKKIIKKTDSCFSLYTCPDCGNDEFYGLRDGLKFIHVETGNSGFFVKEYKPTGKPLTMQIKLKNGDVYFAPSVEFKQLISNKKNK